MHQDQDFQSYFNAIHLSRTTINTALTIIQEQDRTMRDIVNLRINQTRAPPPRTRRTSFNDYTTSSFDPSIYDNVGQYNSTNYYSQSNSNPYSSSNINPQSNNTSLYSNTNTNTNPYYIPRSTSTNSIWSRPPRRTQLSAYRDSLFDISQLTPIDIVPTLEQIANGSRIVAYNNIIDPINTECPITREAFVPSDRVTQLNHCGHIFSTPSFNRWFISNVRCPVCRHDIRDASHSQMNPPRTSIETQRDTQRGTPTHANPDTRTLTSVDLNNNSIENIMSHIANDIRTRIDTTNPSSSITVEYGFVMPTPNTENNDTENNDTENNDTENNDDGNDDDGNNDGENNDTENNDDGNDDDDGNNNGENNNTEN